MSIALASLLVAAIAAPAGQDSRLDALLALVPSNAAALIAIPNPKRLSDDLGECIERMGRSETAIAGRPIDQLKAAAGVSATFDDHGSIVLMQLPRAAADATGPELAPILLLPSTDPPAFAAGNFTAAADAGPQAWRTRDGALVFVKPLARHVAIGIDADAVRGFEPPTDGGIAEALRERLGERGAELISRSDAFAWGGPVAMRAALDAAKVQSEAAIGAGLPFAAEADEARRAALGVLDGLEDGLFVVDADPLGLSLRTWSRARATSELASLAAGGPARGTGFDRLPANPFYFLLRADIAGLGGFAAIERLVALVPGGIALPQWLIDAGPHVHALQFAVSPSRMGIATGGLLNDATLVLASDRPDVVRTSIRRSLEATAGEGDGVRRVVTVTADKSLRSGETADAFEIEETLLPEAAGADATRLGIRRMIAQTIFGSRGFVGFVKQVSGGAIMTFSQRTDVLDRAVKASAGQSTLANDATLSAYDEWLIEDADVEGFVGVGQFGKLLQQLAAMVPGGDGVRLPEIPTSVEPIAFAFDVREGSTESALVLPTGVLALFYDEVRRQAKERLLGDAP